MAVVELKVVLNDTEARSGLENLINKAHSLESEKYKLKLDIDGSAVNHTLINIQKFANVTLSSLKRSWADFKSYIEAPLNLTGVQQFTSMLESMEGSLLLNQIQSNIVSGFSSSVERFDILRTFPEVMERIGFSADESSVSMDRLYQSVLGLPTAFEDIVNSAQYFALIFGDLDKATNLAIAANNAFVASGSNQRQITSGLRQLQYIIEGTQLKSTQWYSLIRSMPLALREVGDALGYASFGEFTNDLMQNKIDSGQFIDTLIEVGLHSEKLAGIVEVMKTRVQASLDNVTNAAKRMGNTFLKTLDETLLKTGGKNIADNIKGVSKIIDHVAEVGAKWIRDNGDKIQALIDKFFAIDWSSVIPNFFEGLVNIADTALNNIGEYITDIGDIISKTQTLFNMIDNSRAIKAIELFGGILGGTVGISLAGKMLFNGLGLFSANATAVGESTAIGGASVVAGTGGLAVSGGAVLISAIVAAVVEYMNKQEERKEVSNENTGYLIENPSAISLVKQMNAASEYLRSPWEIDTPVPKIVSRRKEALASYNEALNKLKELYPDISFTDTANVSKDMRPNYFSEILYDEEYLNEQIKANQVSIDTLLAQRATEDILINEYESMSIGAEMLFYSMNNLWNEFDKAAIQYTDKLSSIDATRERIQSMIEELEKNGLAWEIRTTSNFANIYGDPNGKEGKYFSKKIKESFGGLFRNTTKDFAKVQQELTPKITQLNQDMISAIEGYDMPEAEKSQLYEAWATAIMGIDPEDPASVAQLETMIKEGPDKLITTYLIPLMQSNEALNENKKALYDARLAALGLAGEDLDEQAERVEEMMAEDPVLSGYMNGLVKMSEQLSEKYLPSIENGLVSFRSDLYKALKNLTNEINSWVFISHPKIKVDPVKIRPYLGGDTALYSATGGYMFAPRGTDTIPAMLTPGEYVQRRAAVEHFGRVFMDRINALDLRGALRSLRIATPYSNGGFIKNETRNYRDNHATVNQVFNNSSANYGFRRANRYVRALG